MEIHERIRQRRLELGLSQDELAKRLGYSSGRSAISRIESGKNTISTQNIQKFADALFCSSAYLMGWTNNPNGKAETEEELGDIEAKIIESLQGKTLAQKAAILALIRSM